MSDDNTVNRAGVCCSSMYCISVPRRRGAFYVRVWMHNFIVPNRKTKRATCQEEEESAKGAKASRPPELISLDYLNCLFTLVRTYIWPQQQKHDFYYRQVTMLTKFETKSARVKGESVLAKVSLWANVS